MNNKLIILSLVILFLVGCQSDDNSINMSSLDNSINNNNDSLLSNRIKKGFRAFSLKLPAEAAVDGLLKSNDFVDILGTFRFPDSKGELDTVSMTILQRVKVLAVSESSSEWIVTLYITQEEAELISFSIEKGRINLALRNPDDNEIKESKSIDANKLMKDNR